MKITMKTLYSTPEFTAAPGQTIDLPAKLAKQLIERRYAVRPDTDPAKVAEAKQAAPPADEDESERPAPTASKAAWAEWVAEAYDVDVDEATAMTRRQMIALDEAGGNADTDPDSESDGDDSESDGADVDENEAE